MAICGWCKRSGLKEVVVRRLGIGLEPHTLPNTAKTECKGPETYRDMGADGRVVRNYS